MIRNAKIRLENGIGVVDLDGHEIQNAVSGITITSKPGHVTQLTLSLAVAEVEFEGHTETILFDTTYDALLALGWTPPEGAAR